jgi:CRP-like cAMP-binding protein
MAEFDPRRNQILAALPDRILDQLADQLHPLELPTGRVLAEPGATITDVYFVQTGVVSLVADLGGDRVVEVATVGDEGMVGLPAFLGSGRLTERAAVQVAGSALRMPADALRQAIALADGPLQAALQRYTQAMFTQLARNAACNRAHNVRQRCARWLLMTADRMHADSFDLTQEFLAQMLTVRRATVSEVATVLADDGSISYRRGHITIRDRDRLRANACACYAVIRDAFTAAYQGLGRPGAADRGVAGQ